MPVNCSALIPVWSMQAAEPAAVFNLLTGPQTDQSKQTDANVDAQTTFLVMCGVEPTPSTS